MYVKRFIAECEALQEILGSEIGHLEKDELRKRAKEALVRKAFIVLSAERSTQRGSGMQRDFQGDFEKAYDLCASFALVNPNEQRYCYEEASTKFSQPSSEVTTS